MPGSAGDGTAGCRVVGNARNAQGMLTGPRAKPCVPCSMDVLVWKLHASISPQAFFDFSFLQLPCHRVHLESTALSVLAWRGGHVQRGGGEC